MNDEKIPIEKEIHYLKDYVDLQQLRKDEKYNVEFNCADNVKGFNIEPLLLIPFVENAFKHISHHSSEVNFVKVDMQRSNGVFSFSVQNSKDVLPSTEVSGGIGLPNVKRRLELLYPNKHDLKVHENNETYSIKLNLQVS